MVNQLLLQKPDLIGTDLPKEKSRTDLFAYIETELKAIDADLAPVKTIEYGRVDQGAAWALLARLYLNAAVYTGQKIYRSYYLCKKVIGAGYALQPAMPKLFMADNDKRKDEFMFAINCDGLHTQAYGNTTFFVHAPCGDDHNDYGVGGGWNGYRAETTEKRTKKHIILKKKKKKPSKEQPKKEDHTGERRKLCCAEEPELITLPQLWIT